MQRDSVDETSLNALLLDARTLAQASTAGDHMGRLCEGSLRRAATALLALTLAACNVPTEFTTPIEDPGTHKIDRRLLGTWYGVSRCRLISTGEFADTCRVAGNRAALLILLHITAGSDETALTIREATVALDLADLSEEIRRRAAGRIIQFEVVAHPALLDGVSYYSLRRRSGFGYDYTADGEQPYYIVAQLDVDEQDFLRYRFLSHGYLTADQLRAQGLREVGASRDGEPVFSYPIAEFTRERLLAFLRESHYPQIAGYTFGPFRRLARDLSLASIDTLACRPDRERRFVRFDALADVSVQLAKQDLPKEARESAALALAAERAGVWQFLLPYRLAKVAEAQARSGDLQGAKVAVERIADYKSTLSTPEDADDAVSLARTMAIATAWAGNIERALRLAEALPEASGDSRPRADAFGSIAAVQAQRGDWAGAMQSARRADAVWALLDVEEELVIRGDRARARATLSEAAVLAGANVHRLLAVAERQWQHGLSADARQTVQAATAVLQAKPDDQHARVPLAKVQVGLGDLEGARSTLAPLRGLIEEGRVRISPGDLAAHLIALQSTVGDQVAARNIQQRSLADLMAREAELDPGHGFYEGNRHRLNVDMVKVYAAVGDVEGAIALAQTLSGGRRVEALYAIVEIQQYATSDSSRVRAPLQLAYDSAQVMRAIDPEAFASSPYGIATMARIHKRAGDDRRARLLYREAEQIANRAPLNRYQHTDGVKRRVSDLLMIAGHEQDDGFAADARQTSLRAFELARSMPELAPCDSDELLLRLALPEIERNVK